MYCIKFLSGFRKRSHDRFLNSGWNSGWFHLASLFTIFGMGFKKRFPPIFSLSNHNYSSITAIRLSRPIPQQPNAVCKSCKQKAERSLTHLRLYKVNVLKCLCSLSVQGSCSSCGEDNSKCAYMGMMADQYVAKEERDSVEMFLDTDRDTPFCCELTLQLILLLLWGKYSATLFAYMATMVISLQLVWCGCISSVTLEIHLWNYSLFAVSEKFTKHIIM